VYFLIEAIDATSRIAGGTIQAYRWAEAEGEWQPVGLVLSIAGSAGTYALPSPETFAVGSRWRFEGQVVDEAENDSPQTISDGFIIEGSVPSVANLQTAIDTHQINLTWDLSEPANDRWVSFYTIVARWGQSTQTAVTTMRAASFVWGAGGLGLTDGETVLFAVTASSYAGTVVNSPNVSDYQTSVTIDPTPPAYDELATRVPLAKGATHWYDRLQGHLAYQANRGVSNLQWSAVLVPGELPLVSWQDRRWFPNGTSKSCSLPSAPAARPHGTENRSASSSGRPNAMGIWSDVTLLPAVAVDTTDPEIAGIARASAYSNETSSVSGWTLNLEDGQSGILGYMTELVPTALLTGGPSGYLWPGTSVDHTVADTNPGTLTTLSVSVPLASGDEGSFTPLLRVRNGTGHWSVFAGAPVTMDRTSPLVSSATWTGCSPQVLNVDGQDKTVYVSNGPTQGFSITSNEAVKWTLSGAWFATQNLPATGYGNTVASTLSYGLNPDGTCTCHGNPGGPGRESIDGGSHTPVQPGPRGDGEHRRLDGPSRCRP